MSRMSQESSRPPGLSTKKRYTHRRHHIQLALFHHRAAFSGNRSSALLNLCYRHIVVTLLRHPNGEPHRILIEFTKRVHEEVSRHERRVSFHIYRLSHPPKCPRFLLRDALLTRKLGIRSPSPRLSLMYLALKARILFGLCTWSISCTWYKVCPRSISCTWSFSCPRSFSCHMC
jgi:hypothetical protein